MTRAGFSADGGVVVVVVFSGGGRVDRLDRLGRFVRLDRLDSERSGEGGSEKERLRLGIRETRRMRTRVRKRVLRERMTE